MQKGPRQRPGPLTVCHTRAQGVDNKLYRNCKYQQKTGRFFAKTARWSSYSCSPTQRSPASHTGAAAARLAGADDFITRLPQGYDTLLTNNGANLSQGQRQLIAIARAAVADPPVMILDEATSSIDTRTEAIVQQGMDALMTNRTVFVIAHRLSTVQNSNAIMVLDHGRIIERGSHQDLIAQKGTYYRLYTGAFELE